MSDESPNPQSNWLLRLWLWLPDWLFRILGTVTFAAFVYPRIKLYYLDFWYSGAWFKARVGDQIVPITIPFGQVLVDITYLLIAISFIVRAAPKARATRLREIVLPLVAAFWPFIPWWILAFAQWTDAAWKDTYKVYMQDPSQWTIARFLAGSALIICGNALDVWAYATLMRSLSIVAEARELKVAGPYRYVRHPIYMGQIVAMAGMWLCYASRHLVWPVFWVCFVFMQLYRSRIEDDVLERAFGDRFRSWKQRTFWFV